MTIIDVYIVKKFLGTFFFSIVLILSIAVIFDFSEKIDNFLDHDAKLIDILTKYYLNFIPYFAVLFSSLFTFVSVIYFTSRMAYRTEFIAIICSGMSFNRILVPYFFSATVIAIFSFALSDYVIPSSNRIRLDFEEQYYHSIPMRVTERNIHRQIEPGVYIYMETYSTISDLGHRFSMEKYEDGVLVSKLMSDYVKWDSTIDKWMIRNYYIRDIEGYTETVTRGTRIDTTLALHPSDFKRRLNYMETMSIRQLSEYIDQLKMLGESNVKAYQIEKNKRFAFPFSAFILTLIGVSVSSKKVKGGIGMQLGIGLIVAFSYLLFMQFSSQFAISGSLNPAMAVWMPNFVYSIIAYILYRLAPK
ncbi:MAG TPA: YjgP/YjgQ family permease [Bacteroides sp.]|nr:YjgP/YjgQ family permease [Bacteroides sp.]